MKKRQYSLLIALGYSVTILFGLVACARPSLPANTPKPTVKPVTNESDMQVGVETKRNETLCIAIQNGNELNYNPLSNKKGFPVDGSQCLNLIYESLYSFSPTQTALQQVLGGEMKKIDDVNYSVELNKKRPLKWNDGTPLKVNDVVYTFQMLKRRKAVGFQEVVKSIATVASSNKSDLVTFTLTDASMLTQLRFRKALMDVPILPAHIWQEFEKIYPDDATLMDFVNSNPIGSGAYRVIQADYASVVLQNSTASTTSKAPKFIVLKRYQTPQFANNALETNFLDAWFLPMVEKAETLPKSTTIVSSTEAMIHLRLNALHPQLVDREVRQIVAGSVSNVKSFATTAFGSFSLKSDAAMLVGGSTVSAIAGTTQAEFMSQLWPQGKVATRAYLVGKGGKEDEEKGTWVYKDKLIGPFKLTFVATNDAMKQVALQVIAEAKKTGINFELDEVDANTMKNKLQSGDYQITLEQSELSANPNEYVRQIMQWRGIQLSESPIEFEKLNAEQKRFVSNVQKIALELTQTPQAIRELTASLLNDVVIIPIGFGMKDYVVTSGQFWQGWSAPLSLSNLFLELNKLQGK